MPTIEIIGAWPPENDDLARWIEETNARTYADVLEALNHNSGDDPAYQGADREGA